MLMKTDIAYMIEHSSCIVDLAHLPKFANAGYSVCSDPKQPKPHREHQLFACFEKLLPHMIRESGVIEV